MQPVTTYKLSYDIVKRVNGQLRVIGSNYVKASSLEKLQEEVVKKCKSMDEVNAHKDLLHASPNFYAFDKLEKIIQVQEEFGVEMLLNGLLVSESHRTATDEMRQKTKQQ